MVLVVIMPQSPTESHTISKENLSPSMKNLPPSELSVREVYESPKTIMTIVLSLVNIQKLKISLFC